MRIEYYHSITDKNGYIHSIDNVVFVYYIKSYNMQKVAEELISIRTKHNASGWEKLNVSSCSKYSWYQNVVHIDSLHLSFGKYHEYSKTDRKWIVLPLLRLEVNPSKHAGKNVFQALIKWISQNCSDGTLKKYDYAVDIPYPIKDVHVLGSRKEPGLYKGTIYRGQRQQHGFLKIYDKGKEQGEDIILTRIEHTLDPDKPLSLEKITIINPNGKTPDISKLDNLNKCIVNLCLLVKSYGVDFEPYIAKLNYRRRRAIAPYLYNSGNITELEYDKSILDSLLQKIHELFCVDSTSSEEPPSLLTDKDGFVVIPDDIDMDLPFE